MKPKIELNDYQQSIWDAGVKRTNFSSFTGWLTTLVTFALATGFYFQYEGQTSKSLDGWLMFFAIAHIVCNCIGVFVFAFIRIFMFFMHLALDNANDDEGEPWNEENKTKKSKIRLTIVNFSKSCSAFRCYRLSSISTWIDLIADWGFFAMLVTSGHPILAFLHGGALFLQYVIGISCLNSLYALIAKIDDPLDEEKVNIDELMDKFNEEK